MRFNPLKTLICAVFCVLGVVCLSGCVDPVSLAMFVKDEGVAGIIDKGDGIVTVSPGSDEGLVAGNKKVTGLDPEKYYLIEEWDENGKEVSVQFVGANGERSENLTGIGRVSGGEITGLTNYYNYRVRSAETLGGDVHYQANTTPGGGSNTRAIAGGAITLPGPAGSTSFGYTLTLPPSLPPSNIVEIPILPIPGPASLAHSSTGDDIITMIRRDTVTDYVFFAGVILKDNFFVLRVTSDPDAVVVPPEPGNQGNIGWSVTITYTTDTPFAFSYAGGTTINQDTPADITLSITNAASFTGATFKWYDDKNPASPVTGATYTVPFSTSNNIDYLLPGKHIIYVEAVIGGYAQYSGSAELTVTITP